MGRGRRPWTACVAFFLPNTDHQPLSATDLATPCGRTRRRAGVADLVGEEPVAELGVVAVRVEERVGQMRLVPARRR